jgi:hypothetical protein
LTPEAQQPTANLRARERTAEILLNSAAMLSAMVDDFRRSDRYFKRKAVVVGAWLFLTASSFAVACPTQVPSNSLEASVVVAGDTSRPVYMLRNEGHRPWREVEIIVNRSFRATLGQIDANGGNFTLSPAVLFDSTGAKAPGNLSITDIELRVRDPDVTTIVLHQGRVIE